MKAAMMSRFPVTARPKVTTVPSRPRGGSCAASQARRDPISASTASSWKWVPSTAQMWKSWWLWPRGSVGAGQVNTHSQDCPDLTYNPGQVTHLGLPLPYKIRTTP